MQLLRFQPTWKEGGTYVAPNLASDMEVTSLVRNSCSCPSITQRAQGLFAICTHTECSFGWLLRERKGPRRSTRRVTVNLFSLKGGRVQAEGRRWSSEHIMTDFKDLRGPEEGEKLSSLLRPCGHEPGRKPVLAIC